MQFNNLTEQTDQASKMSSDTMAMGSGIGNNSPIQQVSGTGVMWDSENQSNENYDIEGHPSNNEPQKPQNKTQEKIPEEEKISQGQHEENLNEWYNQLDKNSENIQNWENNLKSLQKREGKRFIATNKTDKEINEWAAINKIRGSTPWEEKKELYRNYLNEQINNTKNENSKLRDNINNTKNNEGYDSRDDEQKREDKLKEEQNKREDNKQAALDERQDNAYERAVEDMRRAGLNPALMFGGGGAAGAGTIGTGGQPSTKGKSKSDKEREAKKRKSQSDKELQNKKDAESKRLLNTMITLLGMTAIRKL